MIIVNRFKKYKDSKRASRISSKYTYVLILFDSSYLTLLELISVITNQILEYYAEIFE